MELNFFSNFNNKSENNYLQDSIFRKEFNKDDTNEEHDDLIYVDNNFRVLTTDQEDEPRSLERKESYNNKLNYSEITTRVQQDYIDQKIIPNEILNEKNYPENFFEDINEYNHSVEIETKIKDNNFDHNKISIKEKEKHEKDEKMLENIYLNNNKIINKAIKDKKAEINILNKNKLNATSAKDKKFYNEHQNRDDLENLNHQNSKKIKTVFSILSEGILENTLKHKEDKIDIYNVMINEYQLHKISEKISKESKSISNEFLSRNIQDLKIREFKKRNNYSIKTENINNAITRPQSASSNFDKNSMLNNSKNTNHLLISLKSNIKSKDSIIIKKIRSPNKFYSDQLEWEEAKQTILERERERILKITNKNLKNKPQINQKSQMLANKNSFNKNNNSNLNKTAGNRTENKFNYLQNDIHNKLTKTKIRNFKKNKSQIYKNLNLTKLDTRRLPENSIKEIVEKLYKEKKLRDILLSEKDLDSNEQNLIEISNSSNLVLLKIFRDKLFDSLKSSKIINEDVIKCDKSIFLTFYEFRNVLFHSGFLKYNHNNIPKIYDNSLINKLTRSEQLKKETEHKLIKHSWEILKSQNQDLTTEKLDFNILIIFLVALLGIYRGNDNPKDIKLKKNLKKKFLYSTDNDDNSKIFNDKSNYIQEFNLNTKSENLTKSNTEMNENNANMNSVKKDYLAITFAKTNSKNNLDVLKKNTKHLKGSVSYKSPKNGLINLNTNSKNFNDYNLNISLGKNPGINEYLNEINSEIKKFFPFFDNKNFVYDANVTYQIKVIFKDFYDNWAKQQFEYKKTKRLVTIMKSPHSSFRPELQKSTLEHAKNFRNRLIKSLDYSDPIKNTQSNNKNLLIEDNYLKNQKIYNGLKLKKERELEKLRTEKLKKQLEECTFNPFVSERSKSVLSSPKLTSIEITQKLYEYAKIKSKSREKLLVQKKLDEESTINLCSFTPKIQRLDRKIFYLSPIRGDPLLKIQYERKEKSRIDKKLTQILTDTGHNINTIKNIEEYLDEEKKDLKRPRFRFDNESCSFKNTLSGNFKIKNIIQNNSKSKFIQGKVLSKINSKNFTNVHKRPSSALLLDRCQDNEKFITDIVISKNRKIKCEFYLHQDPVIITQRFILQNNFEDIDDLKKQSIFDQINSFYIQSSQLRNNDLVEDEK